MISLVLEFMAGARLCSQLVWNATPAKDDDPHPYFPWHVSMVTLIRRVETPQLRDTRAALLIKDEIIYSAASEIKVPNCCHLLVE